MIDDGDNVLLTDFGISNFADSTTTSVSLTMTGAVRWMAPEVLKAEQSGEAIRHTPASDVFSFGMCVLHVGRGLTCFPWPVDKLFADTDRVTTV